MARATVYVTHLYNCTSLANVHSSMTLDDSLLQCIIVAHKKDKFKIMPADLVEQLECTVLINGTTTLEGKVQVSGELNVCELFVDGKAVTLKNNVLELSDTPGSNIEMKGWYTVNNVKQDGLLIPSHTIQINGLTSTYGCFKIEIDHIILRDKSKKCDKTKQATQNSDSESESESESSPKMTTNEQLMRTLLLSKKLGKQQSFVAQLTKIPKSKKINKDTAVDISKELTEAMCTLTMLNKLVLQLLEED